MYSRETCLKPCKASLSETVESTCSRAVDATSGIPCSSCVSLNKGCEGAVRGTHAKIKSTKSYRAVELRVSVSSDDRGKEVIVDLLSRHCPCLRSEPANGKQTVAAHFLTQYILRRISCVMSSDHQYRFVSPTTLQHLPQTAYDCSFVSRWEEVVTV